ncbi:similar to Saccharomyces cerevisiae YGL107C RMD9 Mitochondrial protein required for respiratory growth [Maudiozyma barnettii]|uniref:Similar to Saccharomyces cerevisiae YGL107C RMD9 Mitochondrial protein required for respiratory growth n=1 Tax=Maudiozyma barnettii TaxID=61262 RepID=A0A8H2ZH07_9SACH|nr:Rmd9p [Kazachstania barnettii]CAB4254258.1 similar to Saccharomyces cerevisiae YGL107C RMD9 Mitochondrial protein required for respiratory growth [Kazachstania barnettii]CAD1782027.1 similar to Saccharomyces cerevisiae YGL107C RMD9 Mitochondrial protein required for respiratory growth [Kazachstania barnettii]
MFLRISRNSSQLGYNGKKSLKLLSSASKGFVADNNDTTEKLQSSFTYKRFNSTTSTDGIKPTTISKNDDLDKLNSLQTKNNNNKKNYNNTQLYNRKNNGNNKNRRNSITHSDEVQTSSPWYNQICAFDDCVLQSLSFSRDLPRQNKSNGTGSESLMFWDSLARAMSLYNELIECPDLNAYRVCTLINLLHNGLRINRGQLMRLNKKPDFDSKSFNMEISKNITLYLREISNNILDGKVKCNEYGAMHLLTSFKELNKIDEAVNVWKQAMKKPELVDFFIHPKVVGVMLPLLMDTQTFTFEQCKQLYESSKQRIDYQHPNLSSGFIITCLLAKENLLALETYSKFCDHCRTDHFNYLAEAHLAFIGQCKDIDIAYSFFERAINSDMPYRVNLNVSQVNSLLGNTWTELQDFERVNKTWLTALKFYKTNAAYKNRKIIGILSSLNNVYFEIFFQKYQDDPIEGFKQLQNSVNSYIEINGTLDEPFLNIILTQSATWKNLDIINSLLKNFELHSVPQTIITKRITLKNLGSIDDITPNDIINKWNELITKGDQMGQTYIANADWAALRDATLGWAQKHTGVPEAEIRVELYYKLLKLYKVYCRDARQINRITVGVSAQLPMAQKFQEENNINTINTDDIPFLENLHSLEINDSLTGN